jgi:hypothetical protein
MPPTHPQLKKGIYVLNIIVQGIMEKNVCVKERDPKGTPKTLMRPIGVQNLNGGENLKIIFKRD